MQNLRISGLGSLSNLETERDERKLCYISLVMLRNIQGSLQPLHAGSSLDLLAELDELDFPMGTR